jgi:hypothetical protein
MAPITSNVSFLGIAKETTPGTAVVPSNYIRVTDMKPVEHANSYADEGYRGSALKTYGMVVGVTYGEYEFAGPVEVDEIGWPLAGLLNDLTVTGAGDPYTTTFATLNSGTQQPTSYTLTDYNGNNARAYAGTKFDKLDLAFTADGLLTYTAHGVSISFATAANPTATFSGTTPIANWRCTTTLASQTATVVTDGTLSIVRTATPIHALDGSQAPAAIFAAGDIAITGTLNLVYDSNAEVVRQDYLTGTIVPLTLDWLQSSAAPARELLAQMTTVYIDDATLTRSQGKFAELAIKFTALGNTTDAGSSAGYSPAKFTTKAGLASGTFK